MQRTLAVLSGAVLALVTFRWLLPRRELELFVDMDRVNREARNQGPMDPAEHVYMERVKQRMLQGDRCTHPPLYNQFGAPPPRIRLVG